MLNKFPIYVDIPVADPTRASQWYEDRLGLTPHAGSAKNTAASWIVEDIAAAMKDLRTRGVDFEEYDGAEPGPTTVDGIAKGKDGALAAWFNDSEGNVLGLVQMPPGMSLPGSSLPDK